MGDSVVGILEVAVGAVAMFIPGGQVIGAMLIGAGLGTLVASFMPNPSAATPSIKDLTHTFKAAKTSHKVVYGNMRLSGPLYELGSTGANNEFLHIIIPLAGHELASIGNIFINNILVDGVGASARYAGYVRVKRHRGQPGQVADPDLVNEIVNDVGTKVWTAADHVGTGIAYVYVRLKFDKNIFPNGIQNIQCDVSGKKVYDPRSGRTEFTDNWALIVRDYITSSYGLGLASTEVDDASFIGAANLSEEAITTVGTYDRYTSTPATGVVKTSGLSQNRYTFNGVIDLSKKPTSILKSMLTAGAGTFIPLVEGKAKLIPGAYVTPIVTLTAKDLRGDVSFSAKAKRANLFNTVIGTYAGAESNWQEVSYPSVGDAAAVAADKQVINQQINQPYCTDHERAQRIATLVLKQHRASATLSMPCKLSAIEVVTMDVVKVTLPDLGLVDATFRVVSWALSPSMGVDLTLKEDNNSLYTWNTAMLKPFVPVPPVTNQPTIIAVPSSAAITVKIQGLGLRGQGLDTVFASPDANFTWKPITSADFQTTGSAYFGAAVGAFDAWFKGYTVDVYSGATLLYTENVATNFFDFTMAKNKLTTGGPFRTFTVYVRIWTANNQTATTSQITVDNPAPALPANLVATPAYSAVQLSFVRPPDLDYVGSEVYMSLTSGFTASPTTLIYDGPDTRVPVMGLGTNTTYYFVVRPYDSFGRPTAITPQISATTLSISKASTDNTPPSVPTSPSLTTGLDQSSLTSSAWVTFTWAAASDVGGMLTGYVVQYWNANNTTPVETFTTSARYSIYPATIGTMYYLRVRSQDWAGNLSAWGTTVSIASFGNNTPLAPPTGLTGVGGLDKVIFNWVNPTAPNYLETTIHVSTTSGFTPNAATLKYHGRGNTFIYGDAVLGTTYYAVAVTTSSSGALSVLSAQVGPISSHGITVTNANTFIGPNAISSAEIGTLDAGKINTGTLNAARIGAASITASKLSVSTLSAITANIGDITSGTLTGAVVQTAAAVVPANPTSGGLVKMTSVNGVELFSSNGTRTANFALDGSGYVGSSASGLSWDTAGTVTVPGQLLAGEIVGKVIKTATSGVSVDIGPIAVGVTTYLLRAHDGAGLNYLSVDSLGNAKFNGELVGASGTFTGGVNTGAFTGYAWPATGSGVHISSQGLLAGNPNTGAYFQINTPASGNATINTNIPAYLADAQVNTLKLAANAVTVPSQMSAITGSAKTTTWQDVASVTINTEGGTATVVCVIRLSVLAQFADTTLSAAIRVGSTVHAIDTITSLAPVPFITQTWTVKTITLIAMLPAFTGNRTVAISTKMVGNINYSAAQYDNASAVVIGTKR